MAVSIALLQQLLLACLNFNIDSKNLFCSNEKSDFYELWQQYKWLKSMEMSEAWPDIYDEGLYNNSNLNTQNPLAAAEAQV